jgi:hypothetical protein
VAIAWLITWPVLFAIVTRQTLQVIDLTFVDYVGVLRHCLAGSVLMVVTVTIAQRYLFADLAPAGHVALTCALGCLVYVSYNGLFNRAAIHEALAIVTRR